MLEPGPGRRLTLRVLAAAAAGAAMTTATMLAPPQPNQVSPCMLWQQR